MTEKNSLRQDIEALCAERDALEKEVEALKAKRDDLFEGVRDAEQMKSVAWIHFMHWRITSRLKKSKENLLIIIGSMFLGISR